MVFDIPNFPPIFFNNKRVNKIQNDFLDRLKKEDEVRFYQYVHNLTWNKMLEKVK